MANEDRLRERERANIAFTEFAIDRLSELVKREHLETKV